MDKMDENIFQQNLAVVNANTNDSQDGRYENAASATTSAATPDVEEVDIEEKYVPFLEVKFQSKIIFQTIASNIVQNLDEIFNAQLAPVENQNFLYTLTDEDQNTRIQVRIRESLHPGDAIVPEGAVVTRQVLEERKNQEQKMHRIEYQQELLNQKKIQSQLEQQRHQQQHQLKKRLHENDKDKSPDLDGVSDLFTIDTSPSPAIDFVKVPSYKRAIKDALDDDSSASKKQKDETKCERPRTNGCFNCGSLDHSLRECPRPRNNKRINRAKQAMCAKNERYHVDTEQRFASIRPGKLSDNLRQALNLQRRELPGFIYRMRIYGYPPGWLEEAKVIQSGLTLINSNEESPCSTAIDNHDKFDINKLIDFPGFNAPVHGEFYDDYKHHNAPPLHQMQSKVEFIESLGVNVVNGEEYKRKKLSFLSAPFACDKPSASYAYEPADMDIVNTDPESSGDARSPKLADHMISEDVEDLESQPLSFLEEEHQRLLRALASEGDEKVFYQDTKGDDALTANSPSRMAGENVDNSRCSQMQHPENLLLFGYEPFSTSSATTLQSSQSPRPRSPQTPNNSDRSQEFIKESHVGTPILKFSPFDKLPAGDNFKAGVSDVINFENLPDSTGTYENMKNVIKKVRRFIKLQNDDK